jgi:hypothetical protein
MNANEIETDFDIFKSKIKKNINSLFLDFMVSFPNFDLKFKTINNFSLLYLFIFFIFIK